MKTLKMIIVTAIANILIAICNILIFIKNTLSVDYHYAKIRDMGFKLYFTIISFVFTLLVYFALSYIEIIINNNYSSVSIISILVIVYLSLLFSNMYVAWDIYYITMQRLYNVINGGGDKLPQDDELTDDNINFIKRTRSYKEYEKEFIKYNIKKNGVN